MFSRDFIGVQNEKKGCFLGCRVFTREGRVFTRDCFGGEGVYKVIFLEGKVFTRDFLWWKVFTR